MMFYKRVAKWDRSLNRRKKSHTLQLHREPHALQVNSCLLFKILAIRVIGKPTLESCRLLIKLIRICEYNRTTKSEMPKRLSNNQLRKGSTRNGNNTPPQRSKSKMLRMKLLNESSKRPTTMNTGKTTKQLWGISTMYMIKSESQQSDYLHHLTFSRSEI